MANDYPAKIAWTGDARIKLGTRRIEAALASEEDRARKAELAWGTLTRQKTNVVINSREEAEALRTFVSELERDGDGRVWLTWAHNRAYKRILGELDALLSEDDDAEETDDTDDEDDGEDAPVEVGETVTVDLRGELVTGEVTDATADTIVVSVDDSRTVACGTDSLVEVRTDGGDVVDEQTEKTEAAATAESHPDAIPTDRLTARDIEATDRETVTVTYDPPREDARIQSVTVDLSGHRTPSYGVDTEDVDREVRVTLNRNRGGTVYTHGSRIGDVRTVRIHGYTPGEKVERTVGVRVRKGTYSRPLEDLPDRERNPLELSARVKGWTLVGFVRGVDRIYRNRERNGYEFDAEVTFWIEADAPEEEILETSRRLFPDGWSYDADDVRGTFMSDLDGNLKEDPLPETEPHTWVVSETVDDVEEADA